jgi:hypothetical protein
MNRSTVFQFSNCWKTKPRRADYLSDDNLGWSGHPGALGPSCGAPSFVRSLGTVFGFLMILMLYHVCVERCKLFWGECLIGFLSVDRLCSQFSCFVSQVLPVKLIMFSINI